MDAADAGNCSISVCICIRAIGPQPMQATSVKPSRARCRVATALIAAVRMPLIRPPSMMATG